MDIIKKLNDMRLERNLSVYRLAELSGLTQSTLANTFSRGVTPSLTNLELMCGAMGTTLAQFFTESEHEILLTDGEQELVTNYRMLAPEMKTAVLAVMKSCPKNN